jgi:hypothetical protein
MGKMKYGRFKSLRVSVDFHFPQAFEKILKNLNWKEDVTCLK